MVLEITVDNNEQFEELIQNQDFQISKALVNTILKNLKGKKRHIHALSVVVKDDHSIYDITIDRNDFVSTLKLQLPIFEDEERYEKCGEIRDALIFLEKITH